MLSYLMSRYEEVSREAHGPRYILSWSGGKDSTATAILCHLHNLPLDEIIYAEPMFTKTVSADNPLQTQFIYGYAKPLFESWGYRVTIVRADTTYMDIFHHRIERATKYPEHVGMKYGFALPGKCSVQRDCKVRPIERYIASIRSDVVQYVGICKNEPKRLESLHCGRQRVSLLEKYGLTEADTFELCRKYGLLSPTYGLSKRGGCWFCPWAKPEEQRMAKQYIPDAWEEFVALENEECLAHPCWNRYAEPLAQRNKKI